MKKIINKNMILGFILGAIIFGSIGVIAANYAASTVDYKTDKNNNVKTVKDALDDLYNIQLQLNEIVKDSMVGTLTTNREKSLNVNKGKYLLVVTEYNASSTANGLNTSISATSNNNIDISTISSTVSGINKDYSSCAATFIFKINAKENGTINLVGIDGGTSTAVAGGMNYILLGDNN